MGPKTEEELTVLIVDPPEPEQALVALQELLLSFDGAPEAHLKRQTFMKTP